MARTVKMAGLLALSLGVLMLSAASTIAEAARETSVATEKMTAEEFSAQSRRAYRRVPSRVRVYRGSYYPGPNAVRICNAHYVQEYRPSGTVIVPRMRCYWRG